ncbi:uncharacterized protein LOC116345432 isoform X2 [Contarinia nasturtii]|nr:uncharacterized protein LOC116345432 isoform X2 [Contarinia nasturtii]
MNRLPKRVQQAKRVSPPAVPEIYRHSGSSFGSAGYGSCDDSTNMGGGSNFYATASDPNNSLNVSLRSNASNSSIDLPDAATSRLLQVNSAANVSGNASSSANTAQSQQAFIFHVQNQQPLTHKAAVYYHQQLALQEDQGIDLTQSPGRDSPGSSSGSGSGSRHSTASLDSGRASSYHTSSSVASKPSAYQPFSNQVPQFTNNSGILSSPRCSSVSSCSIGSADMHRTDHEIICDWLRELSMEEYAPLFSEAGYDMPTISRMTPEDLTAIGIKKPRHRERIKQHIDSLQLPDNLPHYIPGSIEEWLRLLRLDEYIQPLLAQGYRQVRDVTQGVSWEDMEDIGIVKLGHQKKLLLAIKRIKDISSGKWIPPGLANNSPQMLNWDHQQQYFEQMHMLNAMPSHISPLSTDSSISNQFYQQPNYQQSLHLMPHNTIMEKDNNDFVLIKLRQPRGRSIDSPDDDENRMIVTFSQHHNSQGSEAEEALHEMSAVSSQYQPNLHNLHPQSWRQYVDGDITPTNEMCGRTSGRDINTLAGEIDRDSLLRNRGMTVPQRNKPIAMVKGNVLHTIPQQQQQQQDLIKPSDDSYSTRKKIDEIRSIAPEPPRRHCSSSTLRPNSLDQICEDYESLTISGQPSKASGPFNSQDIYSYSNQVQSQMHSMPFYDNCNQMSLSMPSAQQPIYANYNAVVNAMHTQKSLPNIQMTSTNHIQTRAEVHAEKVPFTTSNDSKSNSSIDSIDQLPFANDNAGTIKQRVNQYNQMHTTAQVSLDDSQSKCTTAENTPTNLSSATSPCASRNESNDISQNEHASVSVLNDIGNMLANLTDELDAMLEEEKRVGLNDSE